MTTNLDSARSRNRYWIAILSGDFIIYAYLFLVLETGVAVSWFHVLLQSKFRAIAPWSHLITLDGIWKFVRGISGCHLLQWSESEIQSKWARRTPRRAISWRLKRKCTMQARVPWPSFCGAGALVAFNGSKFTYCGNAMCRTRAAESGSPRERAVPIPNIGEILYLLIK
jgi:hypothetical protein